MAGIEYGPETPGVTLLHNPAYVTGFGTRVISLKGHEYEVKDTNRLPVRVDSFVHWREKAAPRNDFETIMFRFFDQSRDPALPFLVAFSNMYPENMRLLEDLTRRRDQEYMHRIILRTNIDERPTGYSGTDELTEAEVARRYFLYSDTADRIGDMINDGLSGADLTFLCE